MVAISRGSSASGKVAVVIVVINSSTRIGSSGFYN